MGGWAAVVMVFRVGMCQGGWVVKVVLEGECKNMDGWVSSW